MSLSFYEFQLVCLVALCLFFMLVERQLSPKRKEGVRLHDDLHAPAPALHKLSRQYLTVYAIVMGADWLQGPYVYSLYKEQYAFPERYVALLFVTGFMTAGLAAPMVGVWADQYGRRKLCMAFCVTYTLSCVLIQLPYFPVLIMGRFLGGFSTSILFSVFESWLISASNSLALPAADLSTIMGRASLVNGFVAAAAGVASNQLVASTGSFASPFVASGVLLLLAWVVIRGSWTENYGSGGGVAANPDILQLRRLGQALKIVRNEPALLVIGLTQTCFEGSMYLFVFNWVPALQEAARPGSILPLGYIFSAFMVSMMIGSLFYTSLVTLFSRGDAEHDDVGDAPLTLHAKLSSLVCAVSAVAFAVSVESKEEVVRFWAFCVFEACVGMYYPIQGMLRGALISNEHRATLSSLFRVPLNIFVVVSLLTGVSSARYTVLTASSLMLVLSSLMTAAFLVERIELSSASVSHASVSHPA
ncbi:uncharacterized protein B0H18DRAFT_1085572 [Fomitopsis serialis]|uniref:uncharacterized protein n=1 Tax=Fomitopsis serialis TaxID=139415 RepID=UPI0020085F68|nr:uncharacterized protein B0H18DRAFT_1085572 [Neoantrodia serialis]KAH9924067.1 hypothetical protein B0H18DRAFT_1085572 [Neoantrodia serialis]